MVVGEVVQSGKEESAGKTGRRNYDELKWWSSTRRDDRGVSSQPPQLQHQVSASGSLLCWHHPALTAKETVTDSSSFPRQLEHHPLGQVLNLSRDAESDQPCM